MVVNFMEEKKKISHKTMAAIGIIVLVFFIPTSVTVQDQESYTTQEPYQVQVQYTELEPYTTQEVVKTTEPYQEQAQIDGSVLSATQDTTILTSNPNTVATFVVKNNDLDSGGTFTVRANFVPAISINGGPILSAFVPGLPVLNFDILNGGTLSGSTYIASQSSGTITITNAALYKVSGYDLIKPSKIITKYRDVSSVQILTKYREVTKYRTETQYRDSVMTRPVQRYVTVFMFQRLLGLY